jgi:Translation initiation factor 3 (IF-3)
LAEPLLNDQIEAQEVDLLDEFHNRIGVVPKAEALALARLRNLDLLIVLPDAMPPVAKIVDYQRYMAEFLKRGRQAATGRVHQGEATDLISRRRLSGGGEAASGGEQGQP